MATKVIREASELGLKPGEWPVTMRIEGVQVWRGKQEPGGGYEYGTISGSHLFVVLND